MPEAPSAAPAAPLVRVWETDVEAASGPEAPAIGAGALAVATGNGDAVVLDAATGRRLGSLSFGASLGAALALAPDGLTAYVPVSRGRFAVVAHALTTGERRWGWRADSSAQGADAGLALASGTVVAPLHDGTVVGLVAASGAELWRLPGTGAQHHAAPLALGPDVIVADDRGRVRRLAAATGDVAWTAEVGEPVYAAPVELEGRLFVSTTRGALAALDAATGRALWTVRLDPAARVTSAGTAPGRAVVGLTDGRVVALDAATGAAVWTWAGTGAVVARPLVSGAAVYVGTMDRRLVALDAATGMETFSVETRGRIKTAPTAAGGRLIVVTEPRHVAAYQTTPTASLP